MPTCKDYTVVELRKIAAKRKIRGRSKMNKVQLCRAISKRPSRKRSRSRSRKSRKSRRRSRKRSRKSRRKSRRKYKRAKHARDVPFSIPYMRNFARGIGLPGRSSMNKVELYNAIRHKLERYHRKIGKI